MDDIDQQILNILSQDSQLSHKAIGQTIHMTGQAVGHRITQLQQQGIIKKFTIQRHYNDTQFIRIFMDNHHYLSFENKVQSYPEISAFYKISGQACYMIISHFSHQQLTDFIDVICQFGRYTVESVIADKLTD